jgi:hypothetical protein
MTGTSTAAPNEGRERTRVSGFVLANPDVKGIRMTENIQPRPTLIYGRAGGYFASAISHIGTLPPSPVAPRSSPLANRYTSQIEILISLRKHRAVASVNRYNLGVFAHED